ncbi:hypothetical protein M408DRAFT_305026 [Serendipita vermifera MAFF 305830]|uniref:Uncharacterized protein n=1 Tax=Serendipita vermifera MAFF 305830 TaxID=933852 RepID=A0A0C3A9C3_SERVB|nr:hypothetical protein M408DRAFT_305026 [Serendipita vermifera MAFF 305830]
MYIITENIWFSSISQAPSSTRLSSIQPVGHLDDIKLIENEFIRKTLGGNEAIFGLWQEVWKDFRNWTQSLSSSSPTEDGATLKMTIAKPLTRKRWRSTAEMRANESQPATPPALESPVSEGRGKQKGRVRFTIERPKATRVMTTKMQVGPAPLSKKKLVILSDNEDEGGNDTLEPECAPTAHSPQDDKPPKSKKRKLDFEDEDNVNLLPYICVNCVKSCVESGRACDKKMDGKNLPLSGFTIICQMFGVVLVQTDHLKKEMEDLEKRLDHVEQQKSEVGKKLEEAIRRQHPEEE